MTLPLLRRVEKSALPRERYNPIDRKTLADVSEILEAVRHGGLEALLFFARKFDGLEDDSRLVLEKKELDLAFDKLEKKQDKFATNLPRNIFSL